MKKNVKGRKGPILLKVQQKPTHFSKSRNPLIPLLYRYLLSTTHWSLLLSVSNMFYAMRSQNWLKMGQKVFWYWPISSKNYILTIHLYTESHKKKILGYSQLFTRGWCIKFATGLNIIKWVLGRNFWANQNKNKS